MRKDKAFTIVELIAATVLISVVFVGGMAVVIPLMGFFTTEQAKHRATDELVLALAKIEKDACQASNVTVSGTTLTLGVTNYADPARPTATIVYDVSGSSLRRTYTPQGGPSGVPRVITNLLDTASPPAYYTYPTPNYPPNYLEVEIQTKDSNSTARQRTGVFLRCRKTAP